MEYISLSAIGNFAAYFGTAIAALLVFKYVALVVTPYDEWKLIKEEKNTAAAIALGASLLGFCLALNGVLQNAVSYVDFLIWAVVAMLAQVAAILLVRFAFMPKFAKRIEENEIGAAVIAGAVYVSIGLINSGSMTY